MKREKKIKEKAEKIVALEKQLNFQELENFISTLTIDEMMEIDDYIMTKKLLTK